LDDKIEIQKNEYNKIINQKENLIKNKENIQDQEKSLNKEKNEITEIIKTLQGKIESLDQIQMEKLKKQKTEI
jgi:FtsZ-binding cell division protein ZapB